MLTVGLVALAFALVIAVGTTAVAVNDAVERWWVRRRELERDGGGGRVRAMLPLASRRPHPLPSLRPGVLVEAPRAGLAGRGARAPAAPQRGPAPRRRAAP